MVEGGAQWACSRSSGGERTSGGSSRCYTEERSGGSGDGAEMEQRWREERWSREQREREAAKRVSERCVGHGEGLLPRGLPL